jgi:uncharacterized protein YgiM (DUF1202 family)
MVKNTLRFAVIVFVILSIFACVACEEVVLRVDVNGLDDYLPKTGTNKPTTPPQTNQPDVDEPNSDQPNIDEPVINEPSVTEPTQPQKDMRTAEYIQSTGSGVNVRSGAGSSYSVLGQLQKGSCLAYIGRTGDWYITRYKERTAYVSAQYINMMTIEYEYNARLDAVLSVG